MAGDAERRYHLRYYKTCTCVYETDARGNCTKNGSHCAFAHGSHDLRMPIYDSLELQAMDNDKGVSELSFSLEKDILCNEDPVWNGMSIKQLRYLFLCPSSKDSFIIFTNAYFFVAAI